MRAAPMRILLLGLVLAGPVVASERARDLGIPFAGEPGPLNAITDVAGVTVGYTTLIEGLDGDRAVRTGVTAILPRGRASADQPVFAGVAVLNGNGEMTGTHWIEESGFLEGPVLLTNTHSVGVVRDAAIAWRVRQDGPDPSGYWWSLAVVAETWDGDLNDINGFHVRAEHVAAALEGARGGALAEGNVGGGTGMICHQFKGGTGTSSRRVAVGTQRYTIGALVQANYGVRRTLRIAGVPVGEQLGDDLPGAPDGDSGSIIIVLATDAPLLPHQLERVARRAPLALGRMGSYGGNGSGDLFLAFSTANPQAGVVETATDLAALGNEQLDPLFEGAVDAAEEAIVNALVAARTMTGDRGYRAVAIDHAALRAVLRRHGRLRERR